MQDICQSMILYISPRLRGWAHRGRENAVVENGASQDIALLLFPLGVLALATYAAKLPKGRPAGVIAANASFKDDQLSCW